MYLKSLELHGFKSFPDRTLLKFNSGTTVIVGPNGSGKSNITDAMRWVLGELSSKNIRGSKMEDVIFAGADDKKPMSFAEVSVTFDDSEEPRTLQSEYDEVTVTRRYYRSGDSEYFINRKKVRLKDIYQLFMNTGIGREGYSIIGQGKIAEIISKKSDDRRGVFEESAGISKYRYKKNESEKKLAETEANMERVADIENELSMRIGPLERDSQKARRYLELYGEKKKTDVSLWIYDSQRLKTAIEKTENDTKLSAHELEMAEDSIRVTSAKIERLYEQSHENKEASRRNYELTSESTKRMSAAESEKKILLREKLHAESNLENEKKLCDYAETSINNETVRVTEIKANLEKIEKTYGEEKVNFDGYSSKIEVLKGEIDERGEELDSLLLEQKSAENNLTDLKVRLNVLESNIKNQQKRTESINSDINKYEEEIAALDKTANDAKDQIDIYKNAVGEIDVQIADVDSKMAEQNEKFASVDSDVRRKQAEIDSLESRISALDRMQEHFDGYNNSIRFIMNESKAGRLSGIRGPLSYLIKVEQKYIVALETSLGAALQNIVTDDEDAAKKSIESLKRNNAGRATFYPLTTIKAQERGRDYDGLENSTGFVGWADELVSCDHEYRNIVKSLLARVVVYDNIDNASKAAKAKGWRIRAVTLDGQQINSGGSFTGGQAKRDSGMLSRSAQIESLRAELEKAVREITAVKAEAKKIQEESASLVSDRRNHEERRRLIEALMNAENKNFSDADGKRQALIALVENMKNDSISLVESSKGSEADLEKLKSMISLQTEKVAEIAGKREGIAAVRGIAELDLAEITDQSNEVRIRLAELDRDREAAENSYSDSMLRLEGFRADRELHRLAALELEGKIKELEESASLKDKEYEELSKAIEELNSKRKKLEETGDDIDTEIGKLRQTEKEQTGKKDILFIAHSKNETKLESLKNDEQKLSARMWEDYELTFASAVKFAEENDCHEIVEGERTSYVATQTELKNKIRALGHVNVDAIDEYNEVKKRYEYIKEQLGDLRASREDLLKILSGIEDDMKALFLDAFAKINKYFGEVFKELFGGGHAEVILTDPENALESGIEINAAPPGKTIKNLNLLSGGEQAFIAIALLFALIKVNPSPFCIFDEIEAALDEVNVTRVGKYVKKYSDEMQIIMISHRRGTMDIADTLYGVTMQQSGVSKVFTLGAADDKESFIK
ncbi:MAG: chromosome segregation protein SMC [Ruminococcaceae bacterium]|nr:chromosome segregation protein SMC [Oscillospiraceae bacterium]